MPGPSTRLSFRLASLALVLVGGSLLGAARAQEARSLRGHELAEFDELDEPRFVERSSHRGWEVHSGHFVVVSTEGPDEARRVAARSEATWTAFSELADHWTEIHRQPQFGRGAVSVWIVDQARPDGRTTWGASDAAEIYLTRDEAQAATSPAEDGASSAAPPLEQLVAAQFLRVARWETRLPEWLQTGLARYVAEAVTRPAGAVDPFASPVADGERPESAAAASASRRAKLLVAGREIAARPWPPQTGDASRGNVLLLTPTRGPRVSLTAAEVAAPDNLERTPPSPSAWVRYWLESSDGRRAGELIEWLRQAVGTPGSATFAGHLTPPGQAEELARWQRDRWAEQPVAVLDDLGDAALAGPARELVVAWKLADRFGRARQAVAGSRVTEFRAGRQVPLSSPQPSPEPIDVDGLREQLLSGAANPWATIDVDGRLLWSRDQSRLTKLLGADQPGRLTAGWEEDHPTLARRLDDGRLLVSWVDELPSAEAATGAGAHRPRIRFRLDAPAAGPQPRVIERGQPRPTTGT